MKTIANDFEEEILQSMLEVLTEWGLESESYYSVEDILEATYKRIEKKYDIVGNLRASVSQGKIQGILEGEFNDYLDKVPFQRTSYVYRMKGGKAI